MESCLLTRKDVPAHCRFLLYLTDISVLSDNFSSINSDTSKWIPESWGQIILKNRAVRLKRGWIFLRGCWILDISQLLVKMFFFFFKKSYYNKCRFLYFIHISHCWSIVESNAASKEYSKSFNLSFTGLAVRKVLVVRQPHTKI